MCRKHEGRVFQVVGCDVKELERWGLSQTGQDLSLEGDLHDWCMPSIFTSRPT